MLGIIICIVANCLYVSIVIHIYYLVRFALSEPSCLVKFKYTLVYQPLTQHPHVSIPRSSEQIML